MPRVDCAADSARLHAPWPSRNSELSLEAFTQVHNECKRGDIVGVEGFPGKSKKGELSIFPRKFVVLTPCLHMPPSAHFGLKDQVRLDIRPREGNNHPWCNRPRRQATLLQTRPAAPGGHARIASAAWQA